MEYRDFGIIKSSIAAVVGRITERLQALRLAGAEVVHYEQRLASIEDKQLPLQALIDRGENVPVDDYTAELIAQLNREYEMLSRELQQAHSLLVRIQDLVNLTEQRASEIGNRPRRLKAPENGNDVILQSYIAHAAMPETGLAQARQHLARAKQATLLGHFEEAEQALIDGRLFSTRETLLSGLLTRRALVPDDLPFEQDL